MTVDEFRERLAPWVRNYHRQAWKPGVRDTETGSLSHFGGVPLLGAGDRWPTCASCEEPMRFLLQLDLATLPSKPRPGAGLLQLFYCSTDDGACETWMPFSGAQFVRIFSGSGVRATSPAALDPYPARYIHEWQPFTDTPATAEQDDLGLHFAYDFNKSVVTVRCDDPGIELKDLPIDDCTAEAISGAAPGDKLGGWPHWVQGVEYPDCNKCQTRMEYLVQIDSEDNLPCMFGDVGCGHICQCPKHPEVLSFGWACG